MSYVLYDIAPDYMTDMYLVCPRSEQASQQQVVKHTQEMRNGNHIQSIPITS